MVIKIAIFFLLVCLGDAVADSSQWVRLLVPMPVRPPAQRSSDQCVDKCDSQYYRQFDQELPEHCNQTYKVLAGIYDPAMLQTFCRITDTFMSCLQPCKESTAKAASRRMMAFNEYMCRNSTFQDNAPCIKQYLDGPGKVCESEAKCGKHLKILNANTGCGVAVADFPGFWKELCLLAVCGSQCTRDLATVCGEEAYRDVQGLAVSYLQMVNAYQEECGSSVPEECKRAVSN